MFGTFGRSEDTFRALRSPSKTGRAYPCHESAFCLFWLFFAASLAPNRSRRVVKRRQVPSERESPNTDLPLPRSSDLALPPFHRSTPVTRGGRETLWFPNDRARAGAIDL